MCRKLAKGREAGRRESMVVVTEGATDRSGNRISTDDVKRVLAKKLGEEARVTILGHVQRGGKPSAYDRWMSTLLGCAAAREMIVATPQTEPVIIAKRHNRISRLPMMEQIRATRAVKDLVSGGDYEGAVAARGASFGEMLRIFETMSTPPELDPEVAAARGQAGAGSKRVAIIHAGGLAPGMNTAARGHVRLLPGPGRVARGLGWCHVQLQRRHHHPRAGARADRGRRRLLQGDLLRGGHGRPPLRAAARVGAVD